MPDKDWMDNIGDGVRGHQREDTYDPADIERLKELQRKKKAKKTRPLKILAGLVIVAGLGVGGWFGYQQYQAMAAQEPEEVVVPTFTPGPIETAPAEAPQGEIALPVEAAPVVDRKAVERLEKTIQGLRRDWNEKTEEVAQGERDLESLESSAKVMSAAARFVSGNATRTQVTGTSDWNRQTQSMKNLIQAYLNSKGQGDPGFAYRKAVDELKSRKSSVQTSLRHDRRTLESIGKRLAESEDRLLSMDP